LQWNSWTSNWLTTVTKIACSTYVSQIQRKRKQINVQKPLWQLRTSISDAIKVSCFGRGRMIQKTSFGRLGMPALKMPNSQHVAGKLSWILVSN
jgi:hypothetical protein